MTLQKTMDKWAQDLCKKASDKDTPLPESTDAFKAVTAYYAVQEKNAKKHPADEDDSGEFSFASSEVVNGGNSEKVELVMEWERGE